MHINLYQISQTAILHLGVIKMFFAVCLNPYFYHIKNNTKMSERVQWWKRGRWFDTSGIIRI